jgi:hypothetical protein
MGYRQCVPFEFIVHLQEMKLGFEHQSHARSGERSAA